MQRLRHHHCAKAGGAGAGSDGSSSSIAGPTDPLSLLKAPYDAFIAAGGSIENSYKHAQVRGQRHITAGAPKASQEMEGKQACYVGRLAAILVVFALVIFCLSAAGQGEDRVRDLHLHGSGSQGGSGDHRLSSGGSRGRRRRCRQAAGAGRPQGHQ